MIKMLFKQFKEERLKIKSFKQIILFFCSTSVRLQKQEAARLFDVIITRDIPAKNESVVFEKLKGHWKIKKFPLHIF